MTTRVKEPSKARKPEAPRDEPAAAVSSPSVPSGPGAAPRPGGGARVTPLAARGEPYLWATGAGLVLAVFMIVGLLALVLYNGALTFWPRPLVQLTLRDGATVLGEVTRSESYHLTPTEMQQVPAEARGALAGRGGWERRRLLRTGNFDLYGDDFRWVADHEIVEESRPRDAWMIERLEWGPAIGFPSAITRDGETVARKGDGLLESFVPLHDEALSINDRIHRIERQEIGAINHQIENDRLAARKAALRYGEGSAPHQEAVERAARRKEELDARYERIEQRLSELGRSRSSVRLAVRETGGKLIPASPSEPDSPMMLAQVVRAYPANDLGLLDRLGIYASRWKEFLTAEPREANTEGGVFPAIFGTLMMTMMMSIVVAPFGVIAALYLREYAKQGPLVSTVRIAVNNLAGVPSIVFGVFGLGFFCYVVGGTIDSVFFPERLPSPTFGTGGILWASLTLALLTVPVVIVATEEAIAVVPRSAREGSYACGASKWQTIRRIVLPRALPGIMTGLILAMARGAGEVAPLMITGVVKLAPELPFDGYFPFLHLERSFMHLGFHIYDVGFQSRNSEAGKPMVFTTTLLLIALVALMNLAAMTLRARLRRRFKSDQF